MTDEQRGPDGPPRRVLVAFVLGVAGLAGPAVATQPPDRFWSWVLLVTTAVLGSAGAVGAIYGDVVDALLGFLIKLGNGEIRGFRWLGRITARGLLDALGRLRARGRRDRARLRRGWMKMPGLVRLVTPMALILVITVAAGFAIPRVRAAADFWWNGCRPPPTLRLLTTPESLAAVSELATAYEQQSADERDGCAAADLYVYAAEPEIVRDALQSGWSLTSLRLIGPRPDVWMPDARVEPDRIVQDVQQGRGTSPVSAVHRIAVSPIVLALPADLVAQDPDRWTRRTWSELLEEVTNAKLSLVRPDPTRSTTGAVATQSVYGGIDGADAAQERWDLERTIGRGLDEGAYPLGDTEALLCRYRAENTPPAALLLSEQALVRYDQGRPQGDGCPSQQDVPPAKKLVAVYPQNTVSLDHPLVDLSWSNQTDRQRRAGQDWRRWLESDAGRAALNDVALRPAAGDSGSLPVVEPLNEEWGARPDALFVRIGPGVNAVDETLKKYAVAGRPARTLVLLDASKSMDTRAGANGDSRFEAARQALREAVSDVSRRDTIGLWTFSGDVPSHEVVPIGDPAVSVSRLYNVLGDIRPAGGTPLYRAIDAGLTGLGPRDRKTVRTLVVITDGEDSDPDGVRPSLDSLVRRASELGIRISFVALGEANCGSPAIRPLSTRSGGDCADSGTRDLSSALTPLFDAVGGGRHGD